jgi:hypothetical protein
MVSCVTHVLPWTFLAASLVAGLAALIRMAGPAAGHGDISGIIRLSRPVTGTILTLFALAVLVFFVGIVRRMRSRRGRRRWEEELAREERPMPAWMRTLTQILSLANFVIIAYLVWRGVIPLTELLALGQGAVAGMGSAVQQPSVGAPAFVTWTFALLAIVAGLGALALALWIAFSDRLAEWWAGGDDDASSSGEGADPEAVADPRAEPDPRRAIMRCYARFERVAAGSGVARPPWLTPMEFMREALRRLPERRGAVPALTSLFELARFSGRPLGSPERERALEALDDITAATEERRADAAAS